MNIIITGPSLQTNQNVSGISAVVNFIIQKNTAHRYIHFEIGKKDTQERNISWLLNIVKSYFKWFYLLLITRNKVVHFNFPLDKRAVLRDCPMLILSRLFGVKMVLHIHGGAYVDNDAIPKFENFLIKKTLSGNIPIIVLGESEKEFLENNYACKKVTVLPNTVDLDDATTFNRPKANDDTCIDILYLGRIRSDKGVGFILAAFKILEEIYDKKYRFHMAGKGRDEKLFVPQFKELLGDKFIFHGVVFGDEKNALLKKCNVFILPSFFEGLPISLLEAMAYSSVPVVTNVGSIKYVVKHKQNGIIVDKKSATDIVDAIIGLDHQPELLNNLAEKARETVFTNFHPDKYIQTLNSVYSYE